MPPQSLDRSSVNVSLSGTIPVQLSTASVQVLHLCRRRQQDRWALIQPPDGSSRALQVGTHGLSSLLTSLGQNALTASAESAAQSGVDPQFGDQEKLVKRVVTSRDSWSYNPALHRYVCGVLVRVGSV